MLLSSLNANLAKRNGEKGWLFALEHLLCSAVRGTAAKTLFIPSLLMGDVGDLTWPEPGGVSGKT